MQLIRIITPGKTREPWLLAALAEYEKRLGPYSKIEWLFARHDKHLLQLCEKERNLIALDAGGRSLTSEQFAAQTERSRLSFVIGGPEGLPEGLKTEVSWSLSPLTFTHQVVRLVLVEQLYRAVAIREQMPYAK